MQDIGQIDVKTASKAELRAALEKATENVEKLRDTVARVMRQSPPPASSAHHAHPDDTITAGWPERHGIKIPRAEGVHESPEAWVKIKHGVIVEAGMKNQSILSQMVALELIDQGEEHHGSLYKDWRAAFLSQVDPSKSGGEGSDQVQAWTKEDRYSKLLHRVEKDYLDAMDCIVANRPKGKHLTAFRAHQGTFVEAFRLVSGKMSEIEREAKEASQL